MRPGGFEPPTRGLEVDVDHVEPRCTCPSIRRAPHALALFQIVSKKAPLTPPLGDRRSR